jgi:hypothetical protein
MAIQPNVPPRESVTERNVETEMFHDGEESPNRFISTFKVEMKKFRPT